MSEESLPKQEELTQIDFTPPPENWMDTKNTPKELGSDCFQESGNWLMLC